MSGAGKVVCVTGASGYLASWLVKYLLERGYTVKATVRDLSNPKKVAHLKALDGAAERLELFEAELLKEGVFDSVIDGCEGVFHTASPAFMHSTDPQREVIEPAVKGTLNVLRSCSKAKSVGRVVMTSSMTAVIFNKNPKGPDVVVDETWFSDKAFCEQIKLHYHLSKTMAEEAAWKFAEENGMDLVVMNPGFILGPLLQPTLNGSAAVFLDIVQGKRVLPSHNFVDVRDVAQAHIVAFENPSASGRICLVAKTLSDPELQGIVHEHYPTLGAKTATENPIYKISKQKAESLGISFTPFEVTLKDTLENLKENNFVSL